MITTPTFTHAALVREAAAHGLHVLCEKPMALSVAECDQMIADCERAKVTLQLAFMRRFDPPFVQAKAQLDAGEIGDVLMVRSLTRGPGLPPAWANDLKTSNGMLAEVNSHDFDAVRWLTGAEYDEVHVRAAARKRPDLRATLPDFYDVAVVSAVMKNGAFGIIDGVCPADYGYDARAEIVGSAGAAVRGRHRAPRRAARHPRGRRRRARTSPRGATVSPRRTAPKRRTSSRACGAAPRRASAGATVVRRWPPWWRRTARTWRGGRSRSTADARRSTPDPRQVAAIPRSCSVARTQASDFSISGPPWPSHSRLSAPS